MEKSERLLKVVTFDGETTSDLHFYLYGYLKF